MMQRSDQLMYAPGHLRPSCTIAADGSLSSESFRRRSDEKSAELGQEETRPMTSLHAELRY